MPAGRFAPSTPYCKTHTRYLTKIERKLQEAITCRLTTRTPYSVCQHPVIASDLYTVGKVYFGFCMLGGSEGGLKRWHWQENYRNSNKSALEGNKQALLMSYPGTSRSKAS
jgi:hypothetical protein